MKSFAILTPMLCAAALVVCAKAAETIASGTAAVSGTATPSGTTAASGTATAAIAPVLKPASPKLKLPNPVAVVEGKEIKPEDVQMLFEATLNRAGKTAADLTDAERDRVLHKLVWDMIGQQFVANRAAIETKITDEELEARYSRFLAGIPDKAKFEERLKETNMTVPKLKEKLRDEMRHQKWLQEKVGKQGAIDEADAKKYYEAHPEFFNQPELVRVSHILVAVPRNATPEVAAAKKKLIETLASRLENGDDFAALAKEHSDDRGTSAKGGDLGYIPKDKTISEFSDAAFALKQDQISPPVKTRFGFHLIKLVDRKAPRKLPFDEVKEAIISRVTQKNQEHLASEIVKKLIKSSDVKNNLPGDTGMPDSSADEPAAKTPAVSSAKAGPAPEKK